MARKERRFLDTVWARLIAGLVAASVSGLLVWINRDALTRAAEPTGPLAECLAERLGHVDRLVADGVVTEGQAGEFRIRARQFCEQTVPAE